MANTKRLEHYGEAGQVLHSRVLRVSDSCILDPADGTFKAAPPTPFCPMPEHETRKGEYVLDEGREAWEDGRYTFAVRRQTGANPAYADPVVGSGEFYIKGDAEVVLDVNPSTRLGAADYAEPDNGTIAAVNAAVTLLRKHATNRMTEADNGDGTKTFTYFDDDGTTPVLTYSYIAAEKTREKAV